MPTTPGIVPVNGLSHVKGPEEPELVERTIPAFLKDTVDKFGDREAAVFGEHGVRWTYREFSRAVDELAAGLLALGLYKGDRVGIWSPNRPEWLLTQFATARIGLVMVNINPAYRRAELEYALNKVGVKALILAPQFKTSDYIQMIRDLAPELDQAEPGKLSSKRLPALETVIQLGRETVAGTYRFDEVLTMASPAQLSRLDGISAGLSPHDPINIQFTSGTTGSPKGATLTHFNIINNGRFVARSMEFSEHDRLCIPVPLYHCFGMVLGNLACVSTGAAMIFPGEAFEPLQTLEVLRDESCTACHGVPTMFGAMIDHREFSSFNLRGLRTGIMAGSPCPIELMKRVISEMHAEEITIAYGMTETSPVSFQSDTKDSIERRVATVGRIHPHVEVRIADENGKTLPVDQPGELLTRGYCVMKGYWNDAELTAEAIDADGWMHTGDIATLDADGYCNIVGRVKDMLIRGGENVYPREIEEFLFTHPDIQMVQVFGVPDPKYGEEICAWIIPQPGKTLDQAAVKVFCDGQIAHYKIPRYVRCVDEIPMTVTGKPQKFIMRDAMVKELGLVEAKTA